MSPSTSEQKGSRGLAIAAVLTIAAAAAYFATRSDDAEAPVSPAPKSELAPVASNPDPASANVASKATSPAPTDEPRPANGAPHGKVTFPDGSIVEAINDVAEDIAMQWDERPYSPITDKVFHNGWWWWKHADGSFSTVKMIAMNGVPQAMSMSVQVQEGGLPTLEQAELARMVGAPLPTPQRSNAPK